MSKLNQKKLLFIIVILFWFAQYVYVPYQTPYLLLQQAGFSFTGIIIGAYGFSQMILRMPIGIMADKQSNHKIFIIIGVTASAMASIIRLIFSPETGFLLGNVLSGFASAMWISFMILYSEFFSDNQLQKAMGLIIAANNIGIFAGFICAALLYDRFGMSILCELSVGAGIVAIVLSFFLNSSSRKTNSRVTVKELITVYRSKRLLFFALVALIQQGILMSTCMSFTTQLASQRGATSMQVGLLSIVYILAAVISSYFAASNIAQKKGAAFWIPITMALVVLYCFFVPNLSINFIIIFQIFMGMSTGILFSFTTSEAIKNIPDNKRSTAMGFFQAVYALGMTVLPIITGILAQKYGIGFLFYINGCIALVGIGCIVFYYKHKDDFQHKYCLNRDNVL